MLGKRDINIILRDAGSLIRIFSPLFIVPLAFNVVTDFDLNVAGGLIAAMIVTMFIGEALRRVFYSVNETKHTHALISVVIVWVLACLLTSIPFILSMGINVEDAVFHSTSALTTTGLNILDMPGNGFDNLPPTLILYTTLISWVGGAGIVLLALVGLISVVRGSQLVSAEGLEQRLKPNLINTAQLIWKIYIFLTLFSVLLLLLSGMGWFDSVNYAMSGVSTTGFGTTSAGPAAFNSQLVNSALMLIVLLGSFSFLSHYYFLTRDRAYYFKDRQVLMILLLILVGFTLTVPMLAATHGYDAIGNALFHTVSAATTGGFQVSDLSELVGNSESVLIVLVGLMFIGGAAGSTAGGIKALHFIVLLKAIYWKTKELVLPEHAIFSKKVGGHELHHKEVHNAVLLIAMAALLALGATLVMMLHGFSPTESIFTVISAQSNVGLDLGIVSHTLPVLVKVTLIVSMLVGRLEIIPFLALIGYMLHVERIA